MHVVPFLHGSLASFDLRIPEYGCAEGWHYQSTLLRLVSSILVQLLALTLVSPGLYRKQSFDSTDAFDPVLVATAKSPLRIQIRILRK